MFEDKKLYRQMTGAQAIADIDVAVAAQIMNPHKRKLSIALMEKLEAAFLKLTLRPVYSVFEEVQRADRKNTRRGGASRDCVQTNIKRKRILDHMYGSLIELVRRRLEMADRRRS